jgi:hypothetical protein
MMWQAIILIEGCFTLLKAFLISIRQRSSVHLLHTKKNQSLSKKFKIDGAASPIGGCIRE